MKKPITIAIDAMGGDNSPQKVIEGISIHSKKSTNVNYKIFGDKSLIDPYIEKFNIKKTSPFWCTNIALTKTNFKKEQFVHSGEILKRMPKIYFGSAHKAKLI